MEKVVSGSCVRSSLTLVAIGVLTTVGCGFTPQGTPPDDDPDAGDSGPTLADCRAQRVVHLVAGLGGLAWFTLEWPPPAVIDDFEDSDEEFAYDNPVLVENVGSVERKLYARRQTAFGSQPLWQGGGVGPHPSAFLVGRNETHTRTPSSAISIDGESVIARGAALQQQRMAARLPVLVFDSAPFGGAIGSPAAAFATTIDDAIETIRRTVGLSPADEQLLRPDATTLTSWVGAVPDVLEVELGERLLFTANLFKLGLVGTVVLPAVTDDPHGAFSDVAGVVAPRANTLANILEGFYRELGTAFEADCGARGEALSLADNVVMVVSGDTPKNSFARGGWPDGTRGGTNYLYVRSNGWLIPGWFGLITPTGKTNFDPQTGNINQGAEDSSNLAAAVNAILYAISRGDITYVESIDQRTFAGVRSPTPP